ncbi:adenylyl-sulfate reductase [bacterium D16-50]|nr:adenylyl-sulfate reductase [bacterium D16-50]
MDLEHKAIERVRTASEMSLKLYGSPLVVTDSGGKDSAVCREIVRRAGIPYEVQHNLTTADAPQTIYYVRDTFKRLEEQGVTCRFSYPFYKEQRVTMWTLIPIKKFPPTRLQRYCCQVLKEASCRDRFITTGVRWAESIKRRKNRGVYENFTSNRDKKIILNNDNDEQRRLFESCELKGKRICNPIVDWTDRDIWDYIRSERLPMNPLYDMGFFRVGCIGCPMAGKRRWMEFSIFPTYKQAYMRAFGRMLDVIHAEGIPTKWKTAGDVFSWWMEDGQIEGQMSLDDFEGWELPSG